MSNVRISDGSPTLERMEGRPAEYPKPSACRNLFGPVNHEDLTQDLKKHCRDIEEDCQRKWNFDFRNHKPLEGSYEWQPVEKDSLPEFYFRPPRNPKGRCQGPGQESGDLNGVRQAGFFIASQGISEDTHLRDQKTEGASESQTSLADQCTETRKRPATDGNRSFKIKIKQTPPLFTRSVWATPWLYWRSVPEVVSREHQLSSWLFHR